MTDRAALSDPVAPDGLREAAASAAPHRAIFVGLGVVCAGRRRSWSIPSS